MSITPGSGITLGDGSITDVELAKCAVPVVQMLTLRGRAFNASCFETWHPIIALLDLEGTGVTDETVKFLSNVGKLQILNLAETEITDAALPYLSSFRYLNLSNTRITCDGLRGAFFTNIQMVQVAVGQFSAEEIRDLKRRLPIVVGKKGLDPPRE